MLAERLYEIVQDVLAYAKRAGLSDELSELARAAKELEQARAAPPTQASTQPQQPNQGPNQAPTRPPGPSAQQRFRSALDHLSSALQSSDGMNRLAPSDVSILKAIGGWKLTGRRLWGQVEAALEQPALGGSPASELLVSLSSEVRRFLGVLEGLAESFRGLGLHGMGLPGEAAEIGVIFPAGVEERSLGDLRSELDEFNLALRVVQEAAGETPGDTRVRALSSGSWILALLAHLAVARVFLSCIEGALGIIDKGMSIGSRYRELRDAGAPEEISDEHINEMVAAAMRMERDRVRREILASEGDPRPRDHEVSNHLDKALDYFVRKIDEGVTFEVRALPPGNGDEDLDEESRSALERLYRYGGVMGEDHPRRHLPHEALRLARGHEGDETGETEGRAEAAAPEGAGEDDPAPDRE